MSGIERRRRGDLPDDEVADVDLFTSVRAEELRFEQVPDAKLSFEGEPAERHSSETERKNLPREVREGETYRGAEIRWRVRGRVVHPADPDD